MPRTHTPGDRLKRHWNRQLAEAGKRLGVTLTFDPHEQDALDRAAAMEDRKAELLDLAADPEATASRVLKVSGEVRQLDASIMRALRIIELEPGTAKASPQHRLAGSSGWTDARRARLSDRNRRVGGGA